MSFLEIRSVCKRIENNKILSDINLSFDNSGMVFIVGKSGAGKSSLMHIIGQLDNDYEGEIFFNGHNCEKNESRMCEIRKNEIGFIFQDFNLFSDLSVCDNINLATDISGVACEIYQEYIKEFDLENSEKKKCRVLSGGEKQRVAIMRVLCRNNNLILADEPTGNLDQTNAKQVFELLKEISKTRLVIVVSHDMEAAKEYADRIITISDGKIIDDCNNGTDKICEENTSYPQKDVKKNIFKPLIKEHIKSNIKRNSMVTILSAILLFICVMIAGMTNAINNVNGSINAILENDRITIWNEDESEDIISEEFINEIKQTSSKDVVMYNAIFLGTTVDDNFFSIKYQVFNNSEFFEKRFAYNGIELPQNENGVIVNSILAQKLYGTDNCIGKGISMQIFDGNTYECYISDVCDIAETSEPAMYMCSDVLKKIYAEFTKNESALMLRDDVSKNYAFMQANIYDTRDKVLYGKLPEKIDEIVINTGGFNTTLSLLNSVYTMVSLEDLMNNKVQSDVIDEVLGSEISIESSVDKSMITKKIVGIVSDDNPRLNVYMSEEAYKDIQEMKINRLDIYLSDRQDNYQEIKEFVDEYGYVMSDDGGAKAGLVASRLSVPIFILGVISVVMLIIDFTFTKMTTKINIMNRYHEIGILMALGTGCKDINSIFMRENMFSYLISVCVATISTLIMYILGENNILIYEGINVVEINLLYLVVVCTLGLIVVYIATIMEVKKIAKINVIDIIKNNI